MNGITPGIFSGKVIRNTNPIKRDVQYGPITCPKPPHPADVIVKQTLGNFPYEPNGLVFTPPEKIVYLKS